MGMLPDPFPFLAKVEPAPETLKAVTSDLKIGFDFSPVQTQRVVYNGNDLNLKSGFSDRKHGSIKVYQ
jgi:hypothetical protein